VNPELEHQIRFSRNCWFPAYIGVVHAATSANTRDKTNDIEGFHCPARICAGSVLLAMGASILGCGGGGAGSGTQSSPPPSITVSVTPSAATVLLGETLSFSASVSNSSDTSASWSVNVVTGGSAQAGTISADEVCTAPADLPSGGPVQVTATGRANASKSATARVTITSDISLPVSPNPASVELGAAQTFQAPIASQGRPDTSIRWSFSGLPARAPAARSTRAAATQPRKSSPVPRR